MQLTAKRKWLGAALFVALAICIDLAVLDRWRARIQVLDAQSGDRLEAVWIIADFNGEQPLINLPVPPHPNHRTTVCMGTLAGRTGNDGIVRFDHLTLNRPLANKAAYVIVFRPGWISRAASTPIRSSLFSFTEPQLRLDLKRGPGDQQDSRDRWSGLIQDPIDPSEYLYTEELVSVLDVVSQSLCDPAQNSIAVEAMRYALLTARTFEERERVRATCGLAAKLALADKAHEIWPFDCKHLEFEYEPTADILELEERIEAKHSHGSP